MLPKVISLGFLGLGVFILVQVIMPVVAFKSWEIFAMDQNQILVDPTPDKSDVLGVSIQKLGDFPAFISDRKNYSFYQDFKLSIPSINLSEIRVLVESNDFDFSLAQLPGTALPGERGNVFITGHSSLPIEVAHEKGVAYFKDLLKVKKGDEIQLEIPGQTFTYIVEGMKVVDPTDVSVINPPDQTGRYLTLMTCVPPGYNVKRLVVLAKLK